MIINVIDLYKYSFHKKLDLRFALIINNCFLSKLQRTRKHNVSFLYMGMLDCLNFRLFRRVQSGKL